MPHVVTVDSGPKVIRVVWMEQVALEHTRDKIQQRHVNRCGRGMQTKVALGQRSGELCVSASLGVVICLIRTRKINCFMDNGPKVRIRCGG